MPLNWWPGLPGEAWEWSPTLYLGPLLIALAPGVATWATARLRGVPLRARHRRRLLLASAALVIALNWPLADMARPSLAVRTVQYLVVTLGAAPLLLLGVPRWSATGRGRPRRIAERALGSALLGAVVLGGAVWATHTHSAIDGLETSAGGQLAVRSIWLAAALWFWWPLVGPGPDRERLPYLGGLVYLILPFAFPKVPAALWVFSETRLYEAYRDVPHPLGWTPVGDQGAAGFILWFPGSVLVAVAVYLLIRHWAREDKRMGLRQRIGVPAHPEAVAVLMETPDTWGALETLVAIMDEAAPPRFGSDLTCEVDGGRVTLQLHFPGTEDDQAAIHGRVSAAWDAYLRRFSDARAAAIQSRLALEVVPYGTRVR